MDRQRLRTFRSAAARWSRAHLLRRSIRLSLTLWYVGILAVILCAFSGTLYLMMARSLSHRLDAQLALQADSVADAVFAFWRAERAAALSGPGNWAAAPSETFRGAIESGRFASLVARWAEKTGQLDTEWPVQFLSRSGQPLGVSRHVLQDMRPLSSHELAAALEGRTLYATLRGPASRLRTVVRPILGEGTVLYLVRVAASRDAVEHPLARLALWLLLLVPLTLVGASAMGWFLATRALVPVSRMISQAQEIGAARLDQRLYVPTTGDELERLARTFNHMLARLEQAFRRLRQFSAASSHELRTPLTVMKGELELALRKPREPEEYQRVLRTHLATVDDMAHVVETLLALARSESMEGAVEARPVELRALAHHVAEMWRLVVQEKAVDLMVEAAESLWVRGEHRLLERVLMNLVDNALRYTPRGGRVTIRLLNAVDEAVLSVTDTGAGIPDDEQPHLFDRFFKPRSDTDSEHSTGLGLGLCRWIVEAHHGRIEVDSRPGLGTTFTISLPRTSSPA